MKQRSVFLAVVVVVLSFVSWLAALPRADADYFAYCCVELQGQRCFRMDPDIECNWGAYGAGYCRCNGGTWLCYSFQPIPGNPEEPLCY
jgi:hypothetical protein